MGRMALDADRVLQAAFEILDAYGLADLSMRRIGEALGVRAGALYYHWENKQSLLAAMVDRMLAGVPEMPAGLVAPALTAWAEGLRSVLLAHRDSADLVSTTRAMGLVSVDIAAGPAARLAASGLDPDDARHAVHAVMRYVLGHVAEEQASELSRTLGTRSAGADVVDAASFAAGLKFVVDGVAAAAH